jgi:hypothetical protein
MNLGFSALDKREHREVLDNCYWPLIDLASSGNNKFGIEASASTLQLVENLDPSWTSKVRELCGLGKIEIIASGWSQIIGPLVPWKVTSKNLEIGNQYYSSTFGAIPKVAFINEQAWSDGLADLYLNSGFESIILEWENAYSANSDWDRALRMKPVSLDIGKRKLNIIWNSSTAFQKLQRVAHGEITLDEWGEWLVTSDQTDTEGSICVYGGDVETIGYRPKRYSYETVAKIGEWANVAGAVKHLENVFLEQLLPSELLNYFSSELTISSISTTEVPIPTKKQPKYNPLRWAVGGRDSVLINTKCQGLYDSLIKLNSPSEESWTELLELWASDFRTHITETRWNEWQIREKNLRSKIGESVTMKESPLKTLPEDTFFVSEDDYKIYITTPNLSLNLNKRKGLAVENLIFKSLSKEWVVGTFQHGWSDDVAWNADFYTSEFVHELPGKPKISDLVQVVPRITYCENYLGVTAIIESQLGALEKEIRIFGDYEKIEFVYNLHWSVIPSGSLRFGDVVINPNNFDLSSLQVQTHNGGQELEKFKIMRKSINHGQSWSTLVSAQQCLGVTEGFILVGDENKHLKISTDQLAAKVPALISFKEFEETYLLRIQFSGRELDDTSQSHNIDLDSSVRVFKIAIEAGNGDK